MKKKYSLIFTVAVAIINVGALNAQNKQISAAWNVKEISMTKWNSQDGLPYMQAPGVNLGAVAFDMIAVNKIAFLSNASNEIIITDRTSGKAINRFSVTFAPRDFVYDNGVFYVLGEKFVIAYSENGKILKQLVFPGTYLGVERVARFNNSTYLLLPSGNCFQIESGKEHEGWITSAGSFVVTKLNGDNSYTIKLIINTGKSFTSIFNTDRTVAGVYVVGATNSRIYLDIQKYISQSPIQVERNIVAVELNANGLGNSMADIKVPDCYYVLSNNDFHLASTGNILNMMTSPQGAFIFTLTEVKAGTTKGYPASLTNFKYHFNDHLIQVDTK